MSNWYSRKAKATLRNLIRHETDKGKKADMESAVDDIQHSEYLSAQRIQDAKMISVRNPAFDGDEVGYPEDDFDDEDKDNFRKYGRP